MTLPSTGIRTCLILYLKIEAAIVYGGFGQSWDEGYFIALSMLLNQEALTLLLGTGTINQTLTLTSRVEGIIARDIVSSLRKSFSKDASNSFATAAAGWFGSSDLRWTWMGKLSCAVGDQRQRVFENEWSKPVCSIRL